CARRSALVDLLQDGCERLRHRLKSEANAKCKMQNAKLKTAHLCALLFNFAFCILHFAFNEKGSDERSQSKARSHQTALREKSLLLQLLAVDAECRPGNCREALLADHVVAVRARAVLAVAHAVEGLFDCHEQVALAVGEGEVELFGVGTRCLVREILDAVVGKCIAGGLVALVGVEQLALLLAERVFVRLKRIGLCFRSGHSNLLSRGLPRDYLWYAMLRINVHAR